MSPEAELADDLRPFQALRDAPIGMTAHLLYTAWDEERPATLSPTIIADIIRARIGFEGLLMSDDLGMEALSGTLADRAAPRIAAGCDVALHCSGVLAESLQVAGAAGEMSAAGLGSGSPAPWREPLRPRPKAMKRLPPSATRCWLMRERSTRARILRLPPAAPIGALHRRVHAAAGCPARRLMGHDPPAVARQSDKGEGA